MGSTMRTHAGFRAIVVGLGGTARPSRALAVGTATALGALCLGVVPVHAAAAHTVAGAIELDAVACPSSTTCEAVGVDTSGNQTATSCTAVGQTSTSQGLVITTAA
jgi:hypothetical protein